MDQIVIELQKEALNSNSDILNLLRKAYLVARKLKLSDFENWINNELNGYEKFEQIPKYRILTGELEGWNPHYGWIPVILEKTNETITTHYTFEPLSSLVNVYNNANNRKISTEFSAEVNNILSQYAGFDTKFCLVLSVNQIYTIIDQVRNIILDWSITLEENGILGDDLQFSKQEKETAINTPTINHYTNNFYGNVSNTQIQQDTQNSNQNNN